MDIGDIFEKAFETCIKPFTWLCFFAAVSINFCVISKAYSDDIFVSVHFVSAPLQNKTALVLMKNVKVQIESPNGSFFDLGCDYFANKQVVACMATLDKNSAIRGEYIIRAKLDTKVVAKKIMLKWTDPDIINGVPYAIRVLFSDNRNNKSKCFIGKAQPSLKHYEYLQKFSKK